MRIAAFDPVTARPRSFRNPVGTLIRPVRLTAKNALYADQGTGPAPEPHRVAGRNRRDDRRCARRRSAPTGAT